MKKIHYIHCENTMKKMWDTYIYFENKPTVNTYLSKKYLKNNYTNHHQLAEDNTLKFIYFIKQAKEYFSSATKCPILIKPLLIYYGMMSLIKSLILTKDPYYPKQTSVLRHGITTRKLKKNDYTFHDDEIKIQKEGLLPLFYTTVTNKNSNEIENKKYNIKDLLSNITELYDCYYRQFNEQIIFPININKQNFDSTVEFSISKEVLSCYNEDTNKLLQVLNNTGDPNFFYQGKDSYNSLSFLWKGIIENPIKYENFFNHDSIVQDYKGKYFLKIIKSDSSTLPEIVINYLLMYNLGILCRYDTELWGEIIFSFSAEDIYIINELLDLSLDMFPNLILNHMLEKKLIFISN